MALVFHRLQIPRYFSTGNRTRRLGQVQVQLTPSESPSLTRPGSLTDYADHNCSFIHKCQSTSDYHDCQLIQTLCVEATEMAGSSSRVDAACRLLIETHTRLITYSPLCNAPSSTSLACPSASLAAGICNLPVRPPKPRHDSRIHSAGVALDPLAMLYLHLYCK
jgi:hypothetical protein